MLMQEILLGQAVARFKKDRNVRAIFVAGSFARGEHHALSDIDLVLIVKKPRHYVRYFYKAVHIEVDSLTLAEVAKRLRVDPISYYALVELKPLFDPDHLAPKIAAVVKRASSQYRASDLVKADLYIQLVHYQLKLIAATKKHDQIKFGTLLLPAQEKCLLGLAAINDFIPMPPLRFFERQVAARKKTCGV